MARVLLDLNNPVFQETWFNLDRQEALAVLATLREIQQMEWQQIHQDRGLRWEAILSRTAPGNQRIYSLRVTKRIRGIAFRQGDFLRFLSLHPDHDSAYK